ncbi:response regulator [Alteromonas sp. CYL-A6]|uniref:response regulator n=1 Tax=Alteromonas nitratireducens TaxID=3390813 RepID=UPI0034C495AA
MKDITAVLIDDEALITDVLKAFMEEKGAVVYDFNSAEQGLDFVKANHERIDVVLTDFKMPGNLSGGDIYSWVTTHYPQIVCYIVTGFIDVRPQGIDENHILEKPIDFDDFLFRVRQDCNARKL